MLHRNNHNQLCHQLHRQMRHRAAVATVSNRSMPAPDESKSTLWPWRIIIGILACGVIIASMMGCKAGHSSKNINLTGELIPQIGVLIETSIPDAGPVGKVNLPKALDKTKGNNLLDAARIVK